MYGRSYQVEEEELESKTKPNIMKVDVTHVEATRAVTPHWNAYAILYQDPMLGEILEYFFRLINFKPMNGESRFCNVICNKIASYHVVVVVVIFCRVAAAISRSE